MHDDPAGPAGAGASDEELRQLAAFRAAGFLDASLAELRYEALVDADRAKILAAGLQRRMLGHRNGAQDEGPIDVDAILASLPDLEYPVDHWGGANLEPERRPSSDL